METKEKTWLLRLRRMTGWLWGPMLWLTLVALDVGYRYLYTMEGLKPWNDFTALEFTMLWALLLCGIAAVMPTLLRRIFSVIYIVFQSLVCLVHGAMAQMFGTVFSFADIAYAGDGAKFFSLDYLHYSPALLLLVGGAVLIAVWIVVFLPKKRYRWHRPVIALVLVALSAVGIWYLDGTQRESDQESFTWDTQYQADKDQSVYTNFSDVNRCFYMMGSYQYLVRSFAVTYGLEDAIRNGATYEVLDDYYAQREGTVHEENAMTGAFADKNLMLVLLESIDTWLLTEDYMPNLYRLQQESINFENHYAPMLISAGTFGSEFTVNTGLLPPTNGVSSKAYSTYAFPYSLAHLFEEKGYTANSFHSSNPSIYSRGVIHQNWGYEKYHNYEDMGMADYQRDSEMINAYETMVAPERYFDFIITYSGHGPYTEELDNISEGHWDQVNATVDSANIPATGSDLEEYKRAVAHAMETDAFIGELIDRMEADGQLDNTVLIFFTDHYCKYMTNRDLVMQLKGVTDTDLLNQTPFFIYSKDTPAQTVSKLTSTMDIAPTIANLFDLDVDYAYYTGDDAFGDGGGYVIFRGMSWYDGEIHYTADYNGEITDYIKRMNQEVSTRVNRSWDTLKSNYFSRRK